MSQNLGNEKEILKFTFSNRYYLTGPFRFILGIFMVWWPNAKHFTLTNQRIKIQMGVLSRRIDEIELYRIKDVLYSASLFERMWGIGNISLLSTQISSRQGRITGIRNAEEIREAIRAYVQAACTKRGVREVDYFRDPASIDNTDLIDP